MIMKASDVKNLFTKQPVELERQIAVLVNDLKKASLDLNMGKQKNTNLLGKLKKDIARLKTVLKVMEISKS